MDNERELIRQKATWWLFVLQIRRKAVLNGPVVCLTAGMQRGAVEVAAVGQC